MKKRYLIKMWMEFRNISMKEIAMKMNMDELSTSDLINKLEEIFFVYSDGETDLSSFMVDKVRKIAKILHTNENDLTHNPNCAFLYNDVLYYKEDKFCKHYGTCVENYIDLKLPQIYTTDHKFAIRLQRWFKNHNIKNEIYAIITPTHIVKKGCELFVIMYESAPLSLFTQLKIRMSIIHSDVRERFRTGHRYAGMRLINLQGCDFDGDVRSFYKSEHHIL